MGFVLLEPDLFPEKLFEAMKPPEATGRVWWILHTRPRQEKRLAKELHRRRVPFYLPLIRRNYTLRARTMTSHVPLFSSYVFLLGDREERIAALVTKRVVNTLAVSDQTSLWQDLGRIHRLINSGAPVAPMDRLVPGTLVRICSGPLAGMEGRLLSTAGRRFVVQIDLIQRGASVLLDEYCVTEIALDDGPTQTP